MRTSLADFTPNRAPHSSLLQPQTLPFIPRQAGELLLWSIDAPPPPPSQQRHQQGDGDDDSDGNSNSGAPSQLPLQRLRLPGGEAIVRVAELAGAAPGAPSPPPYLLLGLAGGGVRVALLVDAAGAPAAPARPVAGLRLLPYTSERRCRDAPGTGDGRQRRL